MIDDRLGGDAGLAGQPPPPRSQPPPAVSAAWPARGMGQPGLSGLLLSFGDALGGQHLA
jgi:hypothetical protein